MIELPVGYYLVKFLNSFILFSPDVLPIAVRTLGAQGGKHGAHEVHSIYWQCISLLYFRSLPQGCYRTYEPHLIGLIMNENTGDFLSLERADILCSMSSFLLDGVPSEQARFVS